MQLIELRPAIGEIHQACEDVGDDPRRSPFFLIVGAGISYPQVPLAETIIEHCQELAQKLSRAAMPQQDKRLDKYSHWFGLAYPQPRQRQKYLRELIENKPISLANLRLAHLLSARKLTNVVVTTNFDDLLTNALRLFGQVPVVSDHPSTVGRIDQDRSDLQIVHVHGSYLFYDFANLQGEVTGRAQLDQETSVTVAGLLDKILWDRSPLVVGYSGWEGDVIMSALRRRISGRQPLGQSIYWFCYKQCNIEELPAWLKGSNDVRFIVPPKQSEQSTAAKEGGEAQEGGPTLPASDVFEHLIKAFNAELPGLFLDPFNYFATQLENLLPHNEGAGVTGDPYSFKALINRIRQAATVATISPPQSAIEAKLDTLRNAIRRSEYERAVRICAELIPSSAASLSPDQRQEVLSASALAGEALLRSPVIERELAVPLAQILSIDPALERAIGPLPDDAVFLSQSRSNQFAYEKTYCNDRVHGVFSYALQNELYNPDADLNRDGQISLSEAVISASVQMVLQENRQTPVIVGNADSVSLFASSKPKEQPKGRLLAVLVGINKYKMERMDLRGPVNDVERFHKVLTMEERLLVRETLVHTDTDNGATLAKIRRSLKWLAGQSRADDLVLFYFGGHGNNPSGDAALVFFTHEYDGKGRGELMLPELVQMLQGAQARKKIVIVDAG